MDKITITKKLEQAHISGEVSNFLENSGKIQAYETILNYIEKGLKVIV